jgi:hypothetical protein
MSLQTKSATLPILTKLHHELLLYLCDFLDATSILNLSLTCKKSHQVINENEAYWKLRYYSEFALDEDWRESAWLLWHSGQTAPKQSSSTSQSKTLEQKATYDWSYIHWRKAYYRRHMLNRYLMDGYWRERCCDLPVGNPKTTSLYIRCMNTQVTLISERDSQRMWILQNDVLLLGPKPGQHIWNELPQPRNIIGKITSILDIYMTNIYIIIKCNIHFPMKSDKDDHSSKDIYERKAIIAWDIRDINRVIPFLYPTG